MNINTQFEYIMRNNIKESGISFTDTCDSAFNNFINGYTQQEKETIVNDFMNGL